MKLWKGRFQKEADPKTNDFNSSISIDSRMYREDIEGSMAHAKMLADCGIISQEDAAAIREGLRECPSMPHEETIHMLELMDHVRAQMGIHYPCEDVDAL